MGSLDSFDPLEETVGADDYEPATNSSRNNCPVHLRITAIHSLDYPGRVAFQYGKEEATKQPGIWYIKDEKIQRCKNMKVFSVEIKKRHKVICNAKKNALEKNPNTESVKYCGMVFGWGEPPKEAP